MQKKAKDTVRSRISLEQRLPETAINIGLIKLIKDLPEYAGYEIKGNYSMEFAKNYSIFAASKDDIVILKRSDIPKAGLVLNSAADHVDDITQQVEELQLPPPFYGDVDPEGSVLGSVTEPEVDAQP